MEQIKTINADCFEYLKTIPDNSIDLVLTDPPYKKTNQAWDFKNINVEILINELLRIAKNSCPIIIFAKNIFYAEIVYKFQNYFRHEWIWNKFRAGNHLITKHQPLNIFENIIVLSKKRANYYPIKVKREKQIIVSNTKQSNNICGIAKSETYKAINTHSFPKNILDFRKYSNSGKRLYIHPNQKPIELLEYLIKTYSNENDLILDPFAGSFSCGIAARNLNRNFIGIEKDKEFFEKAVEILGKGDE